MPHTGTKRVRDYAEQIIKLYHHTNAKPFYTPDIKHIFPPEKIQMLSQSQLIQSTGLNKKLNGYTYRQWKFTVYGHNFIKKYGGV